MLSILSWSDIREKFRITVDMNVESTSVVILGEGMKIKCVEVGLGLYLLQNPDNVTKK